MPNVRAILQEHQHQPALVEHTAAVLAAAEVMSHRHVGAVVVTNGDKVVGIFTERDLLNRVVARSLDPAKTRVDSVMTTPVHCCTPDTTRVECTAVMRSRNIRHLPVVEHGRMVGMVSIRDILEDVTAEQEQTIQSLYEYLHGQTR
jgi:CBS domain-containing protein